MTHVEMREKAEALRVEALVEIEALNDESTDEEKAAVEAKIDKVSELLKRADQMQQLEGFGQPSGDSDEGGLNPEPAPKADIKINFPRHSKTKAFGNDEAGRLSAYRSGQFLLASCFGNQSAIDWCNENGLRGALSTSDNNKGGVLVPEELSSVIIDLREEYGVFRSEARIMPMGSDTMDVPKRESGVTAYYAGNGTSITESDKEWSNVKLVSKKLNVLTRYSSEIAEDAIINLADDLAQEIAWAFAKEEDEAGFNGDGTSTYGGIQGATIKLALAAHAGGLVTAATGNTAFSTLDLTDFHSAVAALPLYARRNAKWYISAAGFAESMERLAYAAGGNTTSTIGDGMGLSFMGYPVVLSQVLNSTLTAETDTIKLLFGDLRLAAMMGSRRDIRVMLSDQRYFESDQIGIKGTERFDIQVHSVGDASNAGPLVALETPSS